MPSSRFSGRVGEDSVHEQFAKDLKSIKSKPVLESVAKVSEVVEAARDLRGVPDLKKLKAAKAKRECYRIRLGAYRVGIRNTPKRKPFRHRGSLEPVPASNRQPH